MLVKQIIFGYRNVLICFVTLGVFIFSQKVKHDCFVMFLFPGRKGKKATLSSITNSVSLDLSLVQRISLESG